MHQHKIKCVFIPAAKEDEEEEHSFTEGNVPAVVVNEEKVKSSIYLLSVQKLISPKNRITLLLLLLLLLLFPNR